MKQRTYRGNIDPKGLADALVARFDHGNLMAQIGKERSGHLVVQITTRDEEWEAASSAISVGIAPVKGGVRVSMGKQSWLDALASLASTGLKALTNPRLLLGRIDDIARDVGKLTLPDQVWQAVEHYVDSAGARLGMSEKQFVVTCPYCEVGNPFGVGICSACGGSLAGVQPKTCPNCGFISPPDARSCKRCKTNLRNEVER